MLYSHHTHASLTSYLREVMLLLIHTNKMPIAIPQIDVILCLVLYLRYTMLYHIELSILHLPQQGCNIYIKFINCNQEKCNNKPYIKQDETKCNFIYTTHLLLYVTIKKPFLYSTFASKIFYNP